MKELVNEYDLLSLAYEKNDFGYLYIAEMIAVIKGTQNQTFENLRLCTLEYIARNQKIYESDLYDEFKNNIKNLFNKKTKIINKKNDKNNKPDFWISIEDEEMPVEIKLHKFNSTALKQLQRYMDFYNTKKGVAVGKELTTELPENIKFIATKEFYKKENNYIKIDYDLLLDIKKGSYCRDLDEPRYFDNLTLCENIILNLIRIGMLQEETTGITHNKCEKIINLLETIEKELKQLKKE